MLVIVGGTYMLSPSFPDHVRVGLDILLDDELVAMILTGSPVIVVDTGFQRGDAAACGHRGALRRRDELRAGRDVVREPRGTRRDARALAVLLGRACDRVAALRRDKMVGIAVLT